MGHYVQNIKVEYLFQTVLLPKIRYYYAMSGK